MAVSSRILLVGGSKPFRIFAEDLLKAGHPAYRAESTAQALEVASVELPDIVIVEAEILEDAGSFATAMANACHSFRPVMVAASPVAIDKKRRAELEKTVDEIIVGPLDAATALFRLEPLARLAIMRNELELRYQTLARICDITELSHSEWTDLPVLILANDPKQAALLGRAADTIGARTVFSDDPFQAERILASEECGALVAIADSESRDNVLDLCYQLRKNARLFHLPILLVADSVLANKPIDAYAQGASGVVPLDMTQEALAIEIGSHLERQNRRRILRDRLMTVIPAAATDSETGLVEQSFMLKHLDTLSKAHTFRHRPLSLVVFAIRNLDAAAAKHGADKAARLHGEVARWIKRLVRVEDTVAHLASGEFAVALPNTDDLDARALMNRIDDVLSHTEFGIDGKPFNPWIAAGYAMARPNETAATFIAHARDTVGEPQF